MRNPNAHDQSGDCTLEWSEAPVESIGAKIKTAA